MKQPSILNKAALAFAAAGLLASASAHADSLVVEQDQNTVMAFTVNAGGNQLAVDTGIFNVTDQTTGTSFLAFCYELLQGLSGAAATTGQDYTANAGAPGAVQTLYNQSFAGISLTSAVDVAAFQIALWEALDDGNMNTGAVSGWAGAHGTLEEDEALLTAEGFLLTLGAGGGAGHFKLTTWTSPDSQDLIQAKIPEPTSLALGALGLAGLSLVRRRKA